METPPPVDVNKLKSILTNAKKIMKVTDEKFSKGAPSGGRMSESYNNQTVDTPFYNETDEKELVYESKLTSQAEARDYTAQDIMNSKMPDNIKQAMLTKPIPKLSYGSVTSAFGLEGLEDLIEKPMKNQNIAQRMTPIMESVKGSTEPMVTLSISQLNEIIDNRLNKALAEMFTKTVSEQTIKKTINTLIKEGKINAKK